MAGRIPRLRLFQHIHDSRATLVSALPAIVQVWTYTRQTAIPVPFQGNPQGGREPKSRRRCRGRLRRPISNEPTNRQHPTCGGDHHQSCQPQENGQAQVDAPE